MEAGEPGLADESGVPEERDKRSGKPDAQRSWALIRKSFTFYGGKGETKRQGGDGNENR
jgi:hypothetical protein